MPTRSDERGAKRRPSLDAAADAPVDGSVEAAVERALARAVVARFLAVELRPRDGLASGPRGVAAWGVVLTAAARTVEADPPGGALGAAVRELVAAGDPADAAAEHLRLFGHTLRGLVCPYESEYGKRALIQQAHELADLAGFYEAFGLKVSERSRERVDHVACELEFFEFLARKEAHALGTGDGEMLEVTRAAERKFLAEHLGRFGRAFAASLSEADPGGYYGRLGALCDAFLESECAGFGVPPGPQMLELRPTEEPDVPMACGSADDLVQIGSPADLEK